MSLASNDQHYSAPSYTVQISELRGSELYVIVPWGSLALAMAIAVVASIITSRNVCALLTTLTTRSNQAFNHRRYLDMIQHQSNHVCWKSMLEVRRRLQTLTVTTHGS